MADALAVRNNYREQTWAMVIKECSESGMSNKAYCEQHGFSLKSYYYWLRKLRTQLAETAPQLVQLKSGPQSSEYLHIEFRGAELKLPAGTDIDAVAAVLRSIQSL